MAFGFFQHLYLLMATGLGLLGVPLPLPLPPLPEDPVLLRTAPADAVLAVQWFGSAQPAPEPANRSERLAAEPEVRAAMAKLVLATRGMIESNWGERRRAAAVLAIYDQLIAAAQLPGCLYVVDVQPFAGGLVLACGDAESAADFAAAVGEAVAGLLPERLAVEPGDVAGVEFATLPLPDGLESVRWTAIDGYFVLTVGDRCAEHAVAALRADAAGLAGTVELRRLRAACKVERPVLRCYAAVSELSRRLPFAARLWQPLGLTAATSALAESGLEGDGFVSRMQMTVPQPDGLLGELRGKPLSQDDLALIPNDASLALAVRGRQNRLVEMGLHFSHMLAGRDPRGEWQQVLDRFSRQMEMELVDDLLAHIDDCVVAWSSPGQGGALFSSAVAAAPMRDGEAGSKGFDAFARKLTEIAPNKAKERADGRRLGTRGYLEQVQHAGHTLWWVDLIDREMPWAICFSATAKHALLGLQPQSMRDALEASAAPNFDQALVRKRMVARRGDAVAMYYLDAGAALGQSYAIGLMTFQLASLELQREGFDFDLADVPRLRSLQRHLGPELAVLEHTEGGFSWTRRGSLPLFDPLLVTCGMALLLGID